MKAVQTSLARTAAATLLSVAALLSISGGASAADTAETLGPNIVANGGFEIGSDPGSQLYIPAGAPYLGGWTAHSREVRVIGTYWQAEEGTRSIGLANYGQLPADPTTVPPSASGVSQTITTKIGQQYRVVFYQAGNPYDHRPSTLRIQLGGMTKDFTYQSDTTARPKNMQWVQRTFIYTATAASTPLAFYASYTQGNNPLGLDNVQVRAIQSAPGAQSTPTPAKGTPRAGSGVGVTTLRISSASLASQGQQTIRVSTGKNAAVTVIIDYPDGTQAAVPGIASASGAYTYNWTLPSNAHGTVHITVDSAGTVAQGSFTVN